MDNLTIFVESNEIKDIKIYLKNILNKATLIDLHDNKNVKKSISLLWIINENSDKTDCHIKLLLKNAIRNDI